LTNITLPDTVDLKTPRIFFFGYCQVCATGNVVWAHNEGSTAEGFRYGIIEDAGGIFTYGGECKELTVSNVSVSSAGLVDVLMQKYGWLR